MSAPPPVRPPADAAAGDGGLVSATAPADMTGICFRDQLWLNSYPLDRNLVFDYFAISPFYDPTCNNEALRLRGVHPLDIAQLSKMTGVEFVLSEVTEPHLFVFRKQRRDGPDKVSPVLTYYILDGSIYQAPQLASTFTARIHRSLYHLTKAYSMASSKLEKIGNVESQVDASSSEAKEQREIIDLKDVKRVDHILTQLLRKLPPVPAPPPFAEGFVPPAPETEKAPEDPQLVDPQANPVDPIFDQGPAKRIRFA